MRKLVRFADTGLETLGRIGEFCILEDPWKDNEVGVSCIPLGMYTAKLGRYNKGGYEAYEILNVPNRSQIKIHIGNTRDHTRGCPLVGDRFGQLLIGGKQMISVLESRDAYWRWMDSLSGVLSFSLEVTEYGRESPVPDRRV